MLRHFGCSELVVDGGKNDNKTSKAPAGGTPAGTPGYGGTPGGSGTPDGTPSSGGTAGRLVSSVSSLLRAAAEATGLSLTSQGGVTSPDDVDDVPFVSRRRRRGRGSSVSRRMARRLAGRRMTSSSRDPAGAAVAETSVACVM